MTDMLPDNLSDELLRRHPREMVRFEIPVKGAFRQHVPNRREDPTLRRYLEAPWVMFSTAGCARAPPG